MKYFLSIENNDYHRWQTELLIESFKFHGKQDDLVIAVAKNDEPSPLRYFKNLREHKNKFNHDNVGRGAGHLPLNKLFAMAHAVHYGHLGNEFMSIHPDMLLYKTVEKWPQTTSNVLYYPSRDTGDLILDNFKKNFLRRNKMWIPMGESMIFKDVPESYFSFAYRQMHRFLEIDGPNWDIEQAAWMASAASHATNSAYRLKFSEVNVEMSLLHPNKQAFMIHYKHGMPSVFNKRNYKLAVESSLILSSYADPLDAMLTSSPTHLVDYLHKIIRTYRQN